MKFKCQECKNNCILHVEKKVKDPLWCPFTQAFTEFKEVDDIEDSINLDEAVVISGYTRSYLHSLIWQGKIKSVSSKHKNKRIDKQSLLDYIGGAHD